MSAFVTSLAHSPAKAPAAASRTAKANPATDHSPRIAAQRKQIAGAFGNVAQAKPKEKKPHK